MVFYRARSEMMIEVLFAESEAGSMKVAKNTVMFGKTDGPVSVWIAGKKKPPKREHTGWIEGTSEEVICLGFMLDIGDISGTIDSQYRKDLIYSLYAQEQWGKDPELDAELRDLTDCYIKELKRLKDYLEAGEQIRVWYSEAPYSICGFYQLCSVLSQYENQIRVVKLPQHCIRDYLIISYKNWGEVAAEEFAGFLQYEKELSREELRLYSSLWSELKEDNSPLRAVVNGMVTGVPEDFYDFLIWKRITEKPEKEARMIGDILGKYPVNIGDWWYAKRINDFIAQGKIRVVQDSENKYARMICLAE